MCLPQTYENIIGSPMQEMSRTVQVSIVQMERAQHGRLWQQQQQEKRHRKEGYPPATHRSNDSCSTVGSSILNHDPFSDKQKEPSKNLHRYEESIPCILVQESASTATVSSIQRPTTAASDVSNVTSQFSMDSDQMHMATARLMEASFGVQLSSTPRLIRLPTSSLHLLSRGQVSMTLQGASQRHDSSRDNTRARPATTPESEEKSGKSTRLGEAMGIDDGELKTRRPSIVDR